MKVTIKLEGMPGLRTSVRRLAKVVETRGHALVRDTSASVARTARSLAPAMTGRLRGSITPVARGLTGGVSIGVPYWQHVEYGTRFMAAQPFARTAAEQERTGLDGRLQAIGNALERDWKGF